MKKYQQSKPAFSAPQLITIGFALLIFTGALLLALPFVTVTGKATSFLDALFTAASAVCVTGLTTLNVAETYNFGGQAIILLLIELGGIGFMSIPVFFFVLAKKKVALSTRMILRESMNLDRMFGEVNLMLYILRFAGGIQLLGTFLLALDFVPRFGWGKGLWFSLFHAISSFCNAGFDIFGDSLMTFQKNPWVLSVISFLIISGGLGFLVWFDLRNFRKKTMSFHSRIALRTTLTLLIVGFFGFLLTEQFGHSLTKDSFVARFFNTLFLSVTPRTAGFYSIDYFKMSHAGLCLTMILMYIGGTSGSTAGGLKTTTLGVLFIKVRSIFKGRSRAEFGGRTIKEATVSRALTLFFLTLSICIFSIMLLSVTETVPNVNQLGLEYIAFEVFSAFGTVGLTMGLTPDLSAFGKLLIILLMFIGRVGVMTVAFSLLTKARQQESKYKYPEENIMIG